MSVIKLKDWLMSGPAPLGAPFTQTVPMDEEVTDEEVQRAFGVVKELDSMGLEPYLAAVRFVQDAFSIKAVAIRFNNMVAVMKGPCRHHHVIGSCADLGMETPIVGEQGFVDGMGNFLTRQEAAQRVIAIGQTLRDPEINMANGLFSENLW